MERIALVGKPILHSKSPELFEAAYSDINYRYILFETDDLALIENKLRSGEFHGVNITAPIKITSLDIIDDISDSAREIGALNTIVVQKDGSLKGHNSDYLGALNAIKSHISNFGDKKFLVLGAGGAAMSVAFALNQLGIKFVLANRTEEKALPIIKKFGADFIPFSELADIMPHNNFIFNTIPPRFDVIDESWLREEQIIFDASYVDSPFSQKLARKKIKYVDGRYWLFYQAVACFELFTGLKPNQEAMRKKLGI